MTTGRHSFAGRSGLRIGGRGSGVEEHQTSPSGQSLCLPLPYTYRCPDGQTVILSTSSWKGIHPLRAGRKRRAPEYEWNADFDLAGHRTYRRADWIK